MATGNIDPTFAGTQARNLADGIHGGNETIPGQSTIPNQDKRRGLLVYSYDFAKHGGAVGEIELGDLPDNILIVDGVIQVGETAMAGAGADTDLGVTGALTALNTAIEGLTTPDAIAGITPVGPIASGVRVGEDKKLILSIGTTAATAGAFTVILDVVKLNATA